MDVEDLRHLFDGTTILPRRLAFLYSSLALALATLLLFAIRGLLDTDVVALLYVPVILLCASLTGPRDWWFAPAASFLLVDFLFTRPYFSMSVSNPSDWLLLAVFLFVGLAASREIGLLQERTRVAVARQQDLKILNRLSAELVSGASIEVMAEAIRAALAEVGIRTLLFLAEDGRLRAVGRGEPDSSEAAVAAWVCRQGKAVGLPEMLGRAAMEVPWPVSVDWPDELPGPARGFYLPLQTSSGRLQGVLFGQQTEVRTDAVDQARVMVVAANLAAAFIEHRDLQRRASSLAALEEADRLKSSFLSAVSHDLKTPLAAAQMRVTGLIENDVACDAGQLREDLVSTAESLGRLDAILGDLLDLSRLEGDAWRPNAEPLAIGEVISTMLSRLEPASRSRVAVHISERTPLVTADFRQLERAIRNIVENALAYTEGMVQVTAEGSPSAVTLAVEDQGVGVPADERERIFDRFYRGEAAAGSTVGSGLGLTIAREIVRAHGGGLRVEDATPHGARFVMTLPQVPRTGS